MPANVLETHKKLFISVSIQAFLCFFLCNAVAFFVAGCTTASTALDRLKPSTARTNTSSPSQSQQIHRRKTQSVIGQKRQKTDQSVFSVYKGVKTFDFSPQTNIMASGGEIRPSVGVLLTDHFSIYVYSTRTRNGSDCSFVESLRHTEADRFASRAQLANSLHFSRR